MKSSSSGDFSVVSFCKSSCAEACPEVPEHTACRLQLFTEIAEPASIQASLRAWSTAQSLEAARYLRLLKYVSLFFPYFPHRVLYQPRPIGMSLPAIVQGNLNYAKHTLSPGYEPLVSRRIAAKEGQTTQEALLAGMGQKLRLGE